MSDEKTYRYMEFWFDDGRLNRSKEIAIVSLTDGGEDVDGNRYLALSDNQHYVTTQPHLDCDCNDFAWGPDRLCKHLIAALLFEGDDLLEQVILHSRPKPNITLVCGPPAAGKSTYVLANAAPYHLLWDYDAMSAAMQVDRDDRSVNTRPLMMAVRDAFMRKLKDMVDSGSLDVDVWIIWSLPKAKKRDRIEKVLGADVVVLETPVEECVRRAEADRPPEQAKAVERGAKSWWDRYERRDGETVVEWEGAVHD